MNDEQIEAHRAEFEKQWAEGDEWRNNPNSGMRGAHAEIAFLKELLWIDYLRSEMRGDGQNWVNRTDRPNLDDQN